MLILFRAWEKDLNVVYFKFRKSAWIDIGPWFKSVKSFLSRRVLSPKKASVWDAFSSCHPCIPFANIGDCLAVSGTMCPGGDTSPEEDAVCNLRDLRLLWGDQANRQFLMGRHAYDAKGVAKRGRLTQAGWEGAGGPWENGLLTPEGHIRTHWVARTEREGYLEKKSMLGKKKTGCPRSRA